MPLKESLQTEMKIALKNKDKVRLETIRSVLNAVKNFEINNKKDLDDAGIQKIIATLVKQHKDSIEQFKKGNREDLVAKEQQELNILMSFLPEQLDEDDIKKVVKEVINEIGNVTKKDFGKIMKAVMSKIGSSADGKLVNQIVKQFIK